jgi:hypothetical protein
MRFAEILAITMKEEMLEKNLTVNLQRILGIWSRLKNNIKVNLREI